MSEVKFEHGPARSIPNVVQYQHVNDEPLSVGEVEEIQAFIASVIDALGTANLRDQQVENSENLRPGHNRLERVVNARILYRTGGSTSDNSGLIAQLQSIHDALTGAEVYEAAGSHDESGISMAATIRLRFLPAQFVEG